LLPPFGCTATLQHLDRNDAAVRHRVVQLSLGRGRRGALHHLKTAARGAFLSIERASVLFS
jgi:hypothetical protein